MKITIVLYLLLIFLVSCNLNTTPDNDSFIQVKKEQELEKESIPKNDVLPFEKEISMYNIPYVLNINPNFVGNQRFFDILLKKERDTVFLKKVSWESIELKLKSSQHLKEQIDSSNFIGSYQLEKIAYYGVRTKNLYFEAVLKSLKNGNKKVLFQIDYLDKIGALFINRFESEEEHDAKSLLGI